MVSPAIIEFMQEQNEKQFVISNTANPSWEQFMKTRDGLNEQMKKSINVFLESVNIVQGVDESDEDWTARGGQEFKAIPPAKYLKWLNSEGKR